MTIQGESTGNRPRILVVDDQPVSLRHLCAALAEDDYELIVATSGEAALDLCRTDCPDLVLMDVVMPGMGGLACCRSLGSDALTRDIPVIFITASSGPDDELMCWEAGAVDFVAKPAIPLTIRKRVGAHLRLKLQADELRRQSLTDGLTEIANRRAFEFAFADALVRRRHDGASLALLLVDVDWFKGFNDSYGHTAGDAALRLVARELVASTRGPDDFVARLGGEEFAVLVSGSGETGALACSQRILSGFARLAHPYAGSPLGHLSVSIGMVVGDVSPDRDLRWFLKQADVALYDAKAAGRATMRAAWSTPAESPTA